MNSGSLLWVLTHWPPEKFEWNFRHVIFKRILVLDGWGISCEIAIIWISLDFTDDQSTLVQQVNIAWRHQAITWANVDPDLCCHMVSLGHNELNLTNCHTSNISGTLVGNKIVDHSNVVGVSPVGATSTTSSFSTWTPCFNGLGWDKKHFSVGIWCALH